MNDKCMDNNLNYLCYKCVFARDGRLICANPNCNTSSPEDTYFKGRNESLTKLESDSIDKYFGSES